MAYYSLRALVKMMMMMMIIIIIIISKRDNQALAERAKISAKIRRGPLRLTLRPSCFLRSTG
jgi:hypothetical protein